MNGAAGRGLQSRFARALEMEFEQRLGRFRAAGLEPEAAHERALTDVLRVEGEALEELRRRGLFPWREEDGDA